jgi:TM2 domain-containing membrane protein YozV
VKSAKSRGVYIILALFFGFLGVHNFYAGNLGRGLVQLLTVLILGWFVIGFVIVFIWVLIECFTVTHDAAGDKMV